MHNKRKNKIVLNLFKVERSLSLIIFLFISLVTFSACGRYGDPLAPEVFSPQAVQELVVATDYTGVNFTWLSPDKNQKGDDLKNIDGYFVFKKEEKFRGSALDQLKSTQEEQEQEGLELDYKLIATVFDNHLKERDVLRKEALSKGKVATRRIDVAEEKKKFSYSDQSVQPGKTYFYKIIPFNQKDVEGQLLSIIKVKYLGSLSIITSEVAQ